MSGASLEAVLAGPSSSTAEAPAPATGPAVSATGPAASAASAASVVATPGGASAPLVVGGSEDDDLATAIAASLGQTVNAPNPAPTSVAPASSTMPEVPEMPEITLKEAISKIKEAIEVLNETLASKDRSIRFRVDETIDRSIITVVDEKTGKIVRQLPSEEMLRVAHNIESLKGILIKEWV